MKEYGHLKNYEIKLTTKSPVFIGSGTDYNKKEYYYDRQHGRVHILKIPAMISLLCRKGLTDEYESYMLDSKDDLYHFLTKANITGSDLNSITEYTADIGDALVKDRTLSAINQFIRDQNGNPYIPGSSLKGCLRTAILWKMISEERKEFNNGIRASVFEKSYLNTLNLNKRKPEDETNSILRGISISDSEPVDPRNMILTKKIDLSVNGVRNEINTIREAIAPNTTVRFILTIDESIHSCLNVDYIRDAIKEYGEYYAKTFQQSFHLPADSVQESFANCVVLGGGSGYFGKSILYPLLGKQEAVKTVSAIMSQRFKAHHHERDISIGISPHMLKYTRYQNSSYHYGICHVELS